jgi:hypothetical protein
MVGLDMNWPFDISYWHYKKKTSAIGNWHPMDMDKPYFFCPKQLKTYFAI